MKVDHAIKALILCIAMHSSVFAEKYLRYEDLGNPTEYDFSASLSEVESAFERLARVDTGPIRCGTLRGNGQAIEHYIITPPGYYTSRYWAGPRENIGAAVEPQRGWVGTLSAQFDVQLVRLGDQKCRVRVIATKCEVVIGHGYTLFPHIRKTARFCAMKSDTFLEYYFLIKLGASIGEKNMPPLKGSCQTDEWAGMKKEQSDHVSVKIRGNSAVSRLAGSWRSGMN